MKRITKAWQLFEDRPELWCKGHLAVDKDNKPISPISKNALRFSAVGALMNTYSYAKLHKPIVLLAVKVHAEGYPGTPQEWNDHPERRFNDMFAMLKKLDI